MPRQKLRLTAPRRATAATPARKRSPRSVRAVAPPGRSESRDLPAILGHFSDALSLLAVAHSSISGRELCGVSDEEVAIRHVLIVLKGVYSDLDRASASLTRR